MPPSGEFYAGRNRSDGAREREREERFEFESRKSNLGVFGSMEKKNKYNAVFTLYCSQGMGFFFSFFLFFLPKVWFVISADK